MATDLDIFAIKERIAAILKNDTDLYTTTAESGKVRKIEAGAPPLNDITRTTVLPHIFITNDDIIEEVIQHGSTSSNQSRALWHQVNFIIILVTQRSTGPKAENQADDLTKLIKETMAENKDLRHPTAGNDPKVSTCTITRQRIGNKTLFGTTKQDRILSLRCKIFTS